MANVCNKNQKRKLTPRQSYKQLGTMLADLTLYTSNACDDNFEEEQFKRNQPDVKSLSEMIAENDTERTLNATSCYLRLMDSDYEKSFIFVPHGVPNTLKNEKPDEKRRSKTIPLKDDTSSASSAQNVSDGESRSPVKQKKQKNRKSDASYDRPSAAPSHMTVLGTNDRPSAAPSHMTVLDNNDVQVTKTAAAIDSGFDAKISVKRKENEVCRLDLAADVADGELRTLRINRQTFRL